jgi:hypothetical protein
MAWTSSLYGLAEISTVGHCRWYGKCAHFVHVPAAGNRRILPPPATPPIARSG